jgi:hypothetical protein
MIKNEPLGVLNIQGSTHELFHHYFGAYHYPTFVFVSQILL